MAPDEEKTTVQTTDEQEAAAPSSAGMKKMILFGGLGVGLLVVGVALALFVLAPMMSGSSDSATSEPSQSSADHSEPKKEDKASDRKVQGQAREAVIYSIKDIVVNPAGTGGSRFLSVSFGFELPYRGLEQDMESREAAVRDALITIMSSKSVAQLTDTKQKEITRYQIKKRVEQILSVDDIGNVYYTDFVLQ
jgi:flagellar FliL protein